MADEMHISSLVVHSRRERAASVAAQLAVMPGVEVHGGIEQAKLVVTLETASESEVLERLDAIQQLAGVLSATLVFHHWESTLDHSEVPPS